MIGLVELLRRNPNYRYTWMGQVVSEVGDHFNNIAVFALVLQGTGSGMAVTGVMLARAIPAIAAGPLAGVLLDHVDRRRIMIVSDLVRAAAALGFIACVGRTDVWLLYLLSAILMLASPFFTSGRASILPTIASKQELHTANSVTQATQWATVAIGSFLGGAAVTQFGFKTAFLFNALSFLFSAICISRLKAVRGAFKVLRQDLSEDRVVRPWKEYIEGLRYLKSRPLLLAIALVGVGWASGGGAAQILFSLFGEMVFHRGPAGIGEIWGCAGLGLVVGAVFAHHLGKRLSFSGYKRTVSICYVIHGGAYVLFSLSSSYAVALLFIALSRAAVAVSSVLNFSQMLRHVADEYRGRVFSTQETLVWSTMMLSMMGAGIASQSYSPRVIGVAAGVVSSLTAIAWGWANWRGLLPEPPLVGADPEEVEVHGDPTV